MRQAALPSQPTYHQFLFNRYRAVWAVWALPMALFQFLTAAISAYKHTYSFPHLLVSASCIATCAGIYKAANRENGKVLRVLFVLFGFCQMAFYLNYMRGQDAVSKVHLYLDLGTNLYSVTPQLLVGLCEAPLVAYGLFIGCHITFLSSFYHYVAHWNWPFSIVRAVIIHAITLYASIKVHKQARVLHQQQMWLSRQQQKWGPRGQTGSLPTRSSSREAESAQELPTAPGESSSSAAACAGAGSAGGAHEGSSSKAVLSSNLHAAHSTQGLPSPTPNGALGQAVPSSGMHTEDSTVQELVGASVSAVSISAPPSLPWQAGGVGVGTGAEVMGAGDAVAGHAAQQQAPLAQAVEALLAVQQQQQQQQVGGATEDTGAEVMGAGDIAVGHAAQQQQQQQQQAPPAQAAEGLFAALQQLQQLRHPLASAPVPASDAAHAPTAAIGATEQEMSRAPARTQEGVQHRPFLGPAPKPFSTLMALAPEHDATGPSDEVLLARLDRPHGFTAEVAWAEAAPEAARTHVVYRSKFRSRRAHVKINADVEPSELTPAMLQELSSMLAASLPPKTTMPSIAVRRGCIILSLRWSALFPPRKAPPAPQTETQGHHQSDHHRADDPPQQQQQQQQQQRRRRRRQQQLEQQDEEAETHSILQRTIRDWMHQSHLADRLESGTSIDMQVGSSCAHLVWDRTQGLVPAPNTTTETTNNTTTNDTTTTGATTASNLPQCTIEPSNPVVVLLPLSAHTEQHKAQQQKQQQEQQQQQQQQQQQHQEQQQQQKQRLQAHIQLATSAAAPTAVSSSTCTQMQQTHDTEAEVEVLLTVRAPLEANGPIGWQPHVRVQEGTHKHVRARTHADGSNAAEIQEDASTHTRAHMQVDESSADESARPAQLQLVACVSASLTGNCMAHFCPVHIVSVVHEGQCESDAGKQTNDTAEGQCGTRLVKAAVSLPSSLATLYAKSGGLLDLELWMGSVCVASTVVLLMPHTLRDVAQELRHWASQQTSPCMEDFMHDVSLWLTQSARAAAGGEAAHTCQPDMAARAEDATRGVDDVESADGAATLCEELRVDLLEYAITARLPLLAALLRGGPAHKHSAAGMHSLDAILPPGLPCDSALHVKIPQSQSDSLAASKAPHMVDDELFVFHRHTIQSSSSIVLDKELDGRQMRLGCASLSSGSPSAHNSAQGHVQHKKME